MNIAPKRKSKQPEPVATIMALNYPHYIYPSPPLLCQYCGKKLKFFKPSVDLRSMDIAICEARHRQSGVRLHYFPRGIEGEAIARLLAEKFPSQIVSIDKLEEAIDEAL